MKTTTSKRPAQRLSTNARVSSGCSSGVSRTAGTEYGLPPRRSTIADSSPLIRASSSATRLPDRDMATILRDLCRQGLSAPRSRPQKGRAAKQPFPVAEDPRLPHCGFLPVRRPARAELEQQNRSADESDRQNRQAYRIRPRYVLRGAE